MILNDAPLQRVSHLTEKARALAYFIKFADRLSNLSRMSAWPPERVEQYLRKSKFWNSEGPK